MITPNALLQSSAIREKYLPKTLPNSRRRTPVTAVPPLWENPALKDNGNEPSGFRRTGNRLCRQSRKVLKVDEASKVEPTAGNDVYLTIDKNLQIATYKMLEQRIAGILESVIVDQKEFTTTSTDTADIRIPVYKVYNAIIENGVIDTTHFTSADASAK